MLFIFSLKTRNLGRSFPVESAVFLSLIVNLQELSTNF